MKKTLLLLASAAMLLVGCAKEKLGPDAGSGEMVTANFTAQMQGMPQTKSVSDGAGAKANRCVMEIYYKGVLYTRDVQSIEGMKATFTPRLVSNRTYDVLFWADCGEGLADKYYTTDAEGLGLQAVEMKATAYAANDDARDAFYTTESVPVGQQVSSETFTLTRPFAQVNIITTDAAIIKNANLYPDGVKMVYKAPTKFNLLTETLSEEEELTVTGTPYEAFDATSAALTLEMDYLFTGEDKSALDIAFEASKAGESTVTSHSFTNIPVQRNYRTNIKGALLTTTGDWTATIVPGWNQPDEEVKYVEEGSIEAANQALAEGKTAILIKSPADAGNPIVIPSVADGKNISIKTEGTNEKTLTFNGATGPANLYIASDAKELVINTPKTHVEVNSGAYTKVTAETSATTLVIAKGVTVETLDVNKGNVEIHGVVNALSRKNGVKAEMYASDRATLINYINWAKPGDIAGLECDIDLAGENWTPLRQGNNRFDATFDGKGYSISNMTVSVDWGYGAGFFSDMSGIAKNFTINNASVANTVADKGNIYGIVAGYAYGNVTFENITVTGSKIHAFGKVGGILGCAADGGGTTNVKNCKVENTEIIGCYNVANYVGLVQNAIVLEGCTSTNVEKKIGGRYGEDSYVTFDNVKVINNDEENPKYVLSSGKYWVYDPGLYYAAFADCYNDIHYLDWKALDGTVDALVFNTPDTPELHDLEPVATIGNKKYYDLPSALAALQQGETLEIVQAGEYTVQTLSTPANTTIDAKVDGVVFNRTPGGWVANQIDGRTVKNITWNVGSANYQYFHGVNLVNCKVNGLLTTHSNNTYTDCEFYNADDYNFWEYGSGSTFTGCKFTCPGGTKGGAVNAYNEGEQGLKKVVFENCEFVALNESSKYAAVYIKPESSFDIEFTNCTANDKFFTGDKSGSRLWNVKAHTNLNTKVTVDGKLVYANGTVLDITTADQLMAFAAAVNSGKNFDNTTVTLGADIDMTGKAWIPIGNVNDYPGKAFYGVFDGQNHIVSNLTCTDNTENYACAGFFGSIMGTVKNLTLKNVNISSKHYAAGIVAYCSSSDLDVENCHVIGGTITSTPELLGGGYDNGDKAGGIVGLASEAGKITGCTVDGVTVRAYRDLGGILGAGNSTISGCTVKNSSIIQDNTNAYKTGIDTYHEILGRDMGATLVGNTFENVTVKSEN